MHAPRQQDQGVAVSIATRVAPQDDNPQLEDLGIKLVELSPPGCGQHLIR
jgi:hypothetical protein